MWRLAVASCSALFLELCCIRWAGSHVLYLSYVSNLLLVTAFMGLGLGATLAPRLQPRALFAWTASGPAWLLLFVSSVTLFNMEVVIDGGKVVYFGAGQGDMRVPPWLALSALGVLMAGLFSTLGVVIGRELRAAAPLRAYSVEIAGSLLGIVLFGCAAWLGVPAHVWFVLALAGFLALAPGRRWILGVNLCVGVVTLALVTNADWRSNWSPYQRVKVTPLPLAKARAPGDPTAGSALYRLEVNNVIHQYITDVRKREPFYEFPYRAAGARLPGGAETFLTAKPPATNWQVDPFARRSGPDVWNGRVAIIGAGNGTDTAAALAYGASHIDAVEIDPLLAHIGQALQPNRSLNDPRVQLHLMDGRTFLERAQGQYDLIIFGLPDSLTLASPYAGVRLESFLFTVEAFRSALKLLKPESGLIVLYNYYRTRWLVDRIANTLGRAAGQKPLVLLGSDENMSAAFIAGPGLGRVDPQLGAAWSYRPVQPDAAVGEASDDWPFLYLRERVVPQQILLAACMLVGLGILAACGIGWTERRAKSQERGGLRALAPFFFMGMAFLLLETSGLIRMSLLFGATWFVNALVFGSVLTMVLLANWIAHVWPMQRSTPLFLLLLATLAVAWALPPAMFSSWSSVPKYLACSVVLFVPILLGNLAFSQAFRESSSPARAFGANLLGAVVGGVSENLALITGYRALFLVAGVLYVLVWVTFPARRHAADSSKLWSAVRALLPRTQKGVFRRGS